MRLRLGFLVQLLGCAAPIPHDLPSAAHDTLEVAAEEPASLGERVYLGEVHDAEGVPFTYERRVQVHPEGQLSTHLTFDVDGEPVVLQTALHDVDYRLLHYTEIHRQRGTVGDIWVDEDVVFATEHPGEPTSRTEPLQDPIHVGPTLFGFVLKNWDALLDGDRPTLRFAVLHDHMSYRFRLAVVDAPDDRVRVRMTATDPFVGLAVAPLEMDFRRETRELLTYDGPIPPLHLVDGRLEEVDGVVHYLHDQPFR